MTPLRPRKGVTYDWGVNILMTYPDMDTAEAAVLAAAPDACGLSRMSACLDAQVWLSPSTGHAFVAIRRDEGDLVDLDEMTGADLVHLGQIGAEVDNALAALGDLALDLDEELLDEAARAQVAHEVARATRQLQTTPELAAELVDRRLIHQIRQAQREMTRLAMARAAHMQALVDAAGGRRGAKAEAARLLGLAPQAVQDALDADDRRWARARQARAGG